nr:hypothetical protein [Tanacetum cinerariifolium]
MENPNHPNDPNVPEGEQAPTAPDGFDPQWIGEHDPNNNNGWIEWDVPLGGKLDEPMVDPEVNEEVMDDDDWDDEVEWLMAPVTPPRATMTVSSTYEIGGPSTAIVERPSSPLPAPRLSVLPTVIENLSTRLVNMEYRYGVLVRKIEDVSDAEVADSITIGEIHPRVATMEEQVESRVDTHPSGQMAVQGQDVIAGSSQQVQTLQTALHETELQNQQLRTRVTKMESHMGILMSYMLWMEDRLTVLKKRLPRPPLGPYGCLYSDNHDSCVLAYINAVNASLKSKSVLKPVNRKIWQPTGKMFTTVGHIWRPTRRTFTLVGNVCSLTRIATTAIVPLREPIPIDSNTDKPIVTLASKTKSWLWHRRLSHLNFGAINRLARQGLVRGLPKLKFEKDHLCSAGAMGKCMKKSHKPKSEDTNQEKLYLLHMDLCGPMRTESVNGKKYILVIFDDYSRFTWVKFLRSMDEDPDFIKFLKMIQVQLKVSVRQDVATACSTQNRSIIRLRHGKTPYELLHNKLPDLSFLYVLGALCYPTNDSENLGKLQPNADIGIFGYAPTKKAFRIYNRRLVQKSSSSTPYVSPLRNDWDLLFQPMFDKLLNPSPSVDHQAYEVIALINDVIPPIQDDSTGSPSSTTVNQDAPSASKSHTTIEIQSSVIPQEVKEENLDIEVAHMGNDPLLGVPITEVTSAQSSSTVSPHQIVQPDHTILQHTSKWTKDHPLNNIIGQLSRPVSTRLQLHEQSLFCYYDTFISLVEPKTYKDALTQTCWIEAMQEELNEFERLEERKRLTSVDTPMVEKSKLDEDKEGKAVDPSHYRGMIGTLLYLTASRPDLQFAICMCARYQARPTEKHDSSVALTAFKDADHAGC